MEKNVTVKINNEEKELLITPIPLGKYPALLKQIKKLPEHLSSLGDLSEEKVLSQLPEIIAESYPDVEAIITMATDLSGDQVSSMSLNQAVDVVVAIFEVNEFGAIYAKVKKAVARPQSKQVQEKSQTNH